MTAGAGLASVLACATLLVALLTAEAAFVAVGFFAVVVFFASAISCYNPFIKPLADIYHRPVALSAPHTFCVFFVQKAQGSLQFPNGDLL